MIYLKTPEEIEKMRAASVLVSQTLGEVARWIEPGVSTRKLDTIAPVSYTHLRAHET